MCLLVQVQETRHCYVENRTFIKPKDIQNYKTTELQKKIKKIALKSKLNNFIHGLF